MLPIANQVKQKRLTVYIDKRTWNLVVINPSIINFVVVVHNKIYLTEFNYVNE